MPISKVNKVVSKGVRLGWPDLNNVASVKLTQLDIKGKKVTPVKDNETKSRSKKNYLIP